MIQGSSLAQRDPSGVKQFSRTPLAPKVASPIAARTAISERSLVRPHRHDGLEAIPLRELAHRRIAERDRVEAADPEPAERLARPGGDRVPALPLAAHKPLDAARIRSVLCEALDVERAAPPERGRRVLSELRGRLEEVGGWCLDLPLEIDLDLDAVRVVVGGVLLARVAHLLQKGVRFGGLARRSAAPAGQSQGPRKPPASDRSHRTLLCCLGRSVLLIAAASPDRLSWPTPLQLMQAAPCKRPARRGGEKTSPCGLRSGSD